MAALALGATLVAAGCSAGRSAGRPSAAGTGDAPVVASTAAPATVPPTTASDPTRPAAPATSAPVTPPPTAPPTTRPAGPPYAVGTVTLPLVDTTRPTVDGGRTISPTRALTTQVWVPAAAGRRPLVVFAHGFDVGPEPYVSMLQAWAAHGWIVAAPEFPLTDPAVAGPNVDEADIDNQPADVRFVTDWLVGPSSPLAARIDPARVVVAGHSDGGETALAASIDAVPAGEPPYRAVIAMSVQPVTSGPSANPPILITQGDADTINPPTLGQQTYALAARPRYMLVLRGGGHLPPLEAGSAWLPGVEAVTETFLDAYGAGALPATPATMAAAAAPYPLLSLITG